MRRRSFAAKTFTQLNAYIALVAVLLIFDLVLATRLAVAWHRSHSDQSAQYTADMATYAQLQATAGHLQALPARLQASSRDAQSFGAQRIAASDSAILAELGRLKDRNHVQLGRANYSPARAIPGLIEWRVQANVTGSYPQIMHFVNDMERDKEHAFFIIRSITLTGQQGGQVNLRVRFTTYTHADAASSLVLQPTSTGEGSSESGGGDQ